MQQQETGHCILYKNLIDSFHVCYGTRQQTRQYGKSWMLLTVMSYKIISLHCRYIKIYVFRSDVMVQCVLFSVVEVSVVSTCSQGSSILVRSFSEWIAAFSAVIRLNGRSFLHLALHSFIRHLDLYVVKCELCYFKFFTPLKSYPGMWFRDWSFIYLFLFIRLRLMFAILSRSACTLGHHWKVPKHENFDHLDSRHFHTIKPLWIVGNATLEMTKKLFFFGPYLKLLRLLSMRQK